MTAATLALRDQLLAIPGGVVAGVDLWFPTQQDPVGPEPNAVAAGGWLGDRRVVRHHPDPQRYVVWVPAPGRNRGAELAPRRALHVNHGRADR